MDALRRDMVLMWEEVAQECKLQTSVDSLRKEMAWMWEEAAWEHRQQGAIGDETAALPGF